MGNYIYSALTLQDQLNSPDKKVVREMSMVKKLLAPIDAYGDFKDIGTEEGKAFTATLEENSALSNDSQIKASIEQLFFSYRHILALRATLNATEKLAFSTIKYDPDKLSHLYETTIYPFYSSSLRKTGQVGLSLSTGARSISSLNPAARYEFGFYIPDPMDQLFQSNSVSSQ